MSYAKIFPQKTIKVYRVPMGNLEEYCQHNEKKYEDIKLPDDKYRCKDRELPIKKETETVLKPEE